MLDILRSTTETKDIRVIIMTALSSEDQRSRGEGLGADRFLVKSQVGIEDVVRTVHEVLGDAPVATSTPGRAFGATGPSAAPRSAAPPPVAPRPVAPSVAPSAPPQASPQPVRPAAPAWQPAPPAATQPEPASAPQATPSPETSGLPQPTAPFSTSRPAGLGDRIIHPLPQSETKPDFNNLMAQELNNTPPTPPPAQPPTVSPQAPQPPAPGLNFEETPLPPAPQPPNPFGTQQPPQA
jgi:hypothetical protein